MSDYDGTAGSVTMRGPTRYRMVVLTTNSWDRGMSDYEPQCFSGLDLIL